MDTTSPRRLRDGSTLPRVRSVARAVRILRTFSPERRHLPLADIARAAELDSGTTRRILVTLRDEGLVRQDETDGTYCLALDLLRLAGAVPEGTSLRELTESRLMRLARDTGATVFLSVLRGREAICLARYHGEAAVQVRWWSVGGGLPLNCGAGPKVLLAHMEPAERDAFLAGPMTQLTSNSVTDPAILRDEVARIQADDWALTQDDVAAGLSALAVPLRNGDGAVLAAISIGGLTPQIVGSGMPRGLDDLRQCGRDLAPAVRSLQPGDIHV